MGFSISWVGVHRLPPARIHERLGYSISSRTSKSPEYPVGAYDRGNDWYILWLDACIHPLNRKPVLQELSKGTTVLITQIHESSMASSTFCYVDGEKTWDVMHESEHGIWHLPTEGEPPAPFFSIRDELFDLQRQAGGEQSDVDYVFDIPIRLATYITGFQHNTYDPRVETWLWRELIAN